MRRSSILKKLWSIALCCVSLFGLRGQEKDTLRLLSNKSVELQSTAALDSMYNFNFESASKQFRWLQQSYSSHPLPYLLFAISTWWRIAPDTEDRSYDNVFLHYIDSTVHTSEQLIKDGARTEGSFFLSLAYALLGRFYAHRGLFLRLLGQEEIRFST